MTVLDTALALTGLYVVTGIVILADLDVTPGSVRRHYRNVARTDPDTALLMRKYPRLCAASHLFAYLVALVTWPLTVWSMAKRRGTRP